MPLTKGSLAARLLMEQAKDLLDQSLIQLIKESQTKEGWDLISDISSWMYRVTVGLVDEECL